MKSKSNWKAIVIVTIMMILTVAVNVNAAGINKKSLTLTKGQSATLSVSGVSKVTWKTSNKAVATVSSKGVVKAVKAGTATITAEAGKKSYVCSVKVVNNTQNGSAGASNATYNLTSSTSGLDAQQAAVYKKLFAMKSSYPEGKKWTDSNYYAWKGGMYAGGYGCAGFAFLMSDTAFGTVKAKTHKNINAIKVGDILRIDNNTHSVVVMKVVGSNVVLAEGNYSGTIHWGRMITKTELTKTLNYVLTRY